MNLPMVSVSTLEDVFKKSNCPELTNGSLRFGQQCYEAGMEMVLKGLAEDVFNSNESFVPSKSTKMLMKN